MNQSSQHAAATTPAATTIHTNDTGLRTGAISIPTPDGHIPGWYAMPEGATRPPVMLVVQEIFGVHEHIRDIARRFARAGYLAVAPELYLRQGDTSRLTEFPEILKIVSRVPDAQVLGDLDAAMRWAAGQGGDVDRLGIAGFCWGGRIVWLYAAHQPRLRAGLAWYGRLAGGPTELQPRFPRDVAAELKAPVLGFYGGQDQSIPPDTVESMQQALAAAGGASRIQVYPEAPHAFLADYRASYRPEAAQDSWRRGLAWLLQHGV